MKGEIFIIFLFLLIFVYSNNKFKGKKQIDFYDYKFQLFDLINEKEDNNSDQTSDNNNDDDNGNDDDNEDGIDSGKKDDDDNKNLIICLIIASIIVLIIIAIVIIYFLKSKFEYDKLNEKINQISFSDENNNNRESKTEDLN